MIAAMDLIATFPLVIGAIINVSASAMDALVERLLTIALAAFVIGSVAIFVVTAFAWLWIKHAAGALLHLPPIAARS
jgi:hypothetical protein